MRMPALGPSQAVTPACRGRPAMVPEKLWSAFPLFVAVTTGTPWSENTHSHKSYAELRCVLSQRPERRADLADELVSVLRDANRTGRAE
jgi:hypothetical protein